MEAFMLHLLPIFLQLCHVTKARLSLNLWMLPTFSSVPLALLFTLYLKLPDSHLCSYPWYKLKKRILYICHIMANTSVRVSLTITTSLKMESSRHSPEPCQQDPAVSRVTAGMPAAVLVWKCPVGKPLLLTRLGMKIKKIRNAISERHSLKQTNKKTNTFILMIFFFQALRTDVISLDLLYLQ